MRRWVVQAPAGKDRLFDSKKAADQHCRAWLQEHPGSELTLLWRKEMRATAKYRGVAGEVIVEKLHRRAGAGRQPQRQARCAAELIDIVLQDELGLTARDAARARQALVEVWKEGLRSEGLVWTPAGGVVVANDPRVQRPRKRTEGWKLIQRKIKIGFKANEKYFPPPTKTEYSERQFAYAQQMGLIEESPRPQPRLLAARWLQKKPRPPQ